MDWRQAILSAIASPEVLFLLLLGALAGLGAEISHPGLDLPRRRRRGLPDPVPVREPDHPRQLGRRPAGRCWRSACSSAEVKVHSYGLLTIGGLVAMILGAMMLVDSPLPELRVNLWRAGCRRSSPSRRSWRRSCAWSSSPSGAGRGRAPRGSSGQVGRAETDLAPEGWVIVDGERWRAVAGDAGVARRVGHGRVDGWAPAAGPKGGVRCHRWCSSSASSCSGSCSRSRC